MNIKYNVYYIRSVLQFFFATSVLVASEKLHEAVLVQFPHTIKVLILI